MEEKILIKGEKANYKIFTTTMYVLSIFAAIIGAMVSHLFGEAIFFIIIFAPFGLPFIITGIVVSCWLSKMELVVTDKRVYGKVAFGKRVDLPLDSVSSVGTSAIGGIDVGTSSGKIHFKLVKNKDDVHKVIGDLIIQRQQEKSNTNSTEITDADEIKKFKELLDSGIITQEEFDAKKKQLLGL